MGAGCKRGRRGETRRPSAAPCLRCCCPFSGGGAAQKGNALNSSPPACLQEERVDVGRAKQVHMSHHCVCRLFVQRLQHHPHPPPAGERRRAVRHCLSGSRRQRRWSTMQTQRRTGSRQPPRALRTGTPRPRAPRGGSAARLQTPVAGRALLCECQRRRLGHPQMAALHQKPTLQTQHCSATNAPAQYRRASAASPWRHRRSGRRARTPAAARTAAALGR